MLNEAYVDCMSLYICCHSQRVDAIFKVTAYDSDRGLRHDHVQDLVVPFGALPMAEEEPALLSAAAAEEERPQARKRGMTQRKYAKQAEEYSKKKPWF